MCRAGVRADPGVRAHVCVRAWRASVSRVCASATCARATSVPERRALPPLRYATGCPQSNTNTACSAGLTCRLACWELLFCSVAFGGCVRLYHVVRSGCGSAMGADRRQGTMTISVEITSAMRFAAADRQWALERLMGAGGASASDMIEQGALRAARYWESFSECYSAELVEAGRALVAAFGQAPEQYLADVNFVALVKRADELEGDSGIGSEYGRNYRIANEMVDAFGVLPTKALRLNAYATESELSAALFVSSAYLELVQRCADLAAVQS
jgi:hypothetical protein